jgi:acetyl-CoA C-acetyltransferase
MKEAVIVSGARTAISAFGGGERRSRHRPGALVIREALKRVNLKPAPSQAMKAAAPDKLKTRADRSREKHPIGGQGRAGGRGRGHYGQCPAGRPGAESRPPGLDPRGPVQGDARYDRQQGASGLKAIAVGASAIITGQADVVVAGGMENMSLAPMAMAKARWGYRMELSGQGQVQDLMVYDGLYEIFYGYHMGVTAENIASLYKISRTEQDELGVLSHNRAMAAIKGGLFGDEITPVLIKDRKGDIVFKTDERPRNQHG